MSDKNICQTSASELRANKTTNVLKCFIHTYIHAIFHVVYTDSSLTVYSRLPDTDGKPFSKCK